MKKYLLAFCLFAFPAFAQDVQLKVEDCHAASASVLQNQPWPWRRPNLQNYIELCSVQNPQSSVVLNILTVRVDRMYRDKIFENGQFIAIPNPLILDTNYNEVGKLPESFPGDPPGLLGVTFFDWKNGFPTQIKLYEHGQSAIDPGWLPYVFNWNGQKYVMRRCTEQDTKCP